MEGLRPPRRDPPTLVSVVMPALDGGRWIGTQLRALARQDYAGEWELVVADNGSTDDTVEVAERFADDIPALRVVHASPRGICRARNVGVEAARGELLLFCDVDDEVSPSWIRHMVAAALTADVVGGRLDLERFNAGLAGADSPAPGGLRLAFGFLPYATGAALGIWKDVLAALGGWDEAFARSGGDDVDLCWRAQLAGYVLAPAEEAVVAYRLPRSAGAIVRRGAAYGQATALLYRRYRERGLPPARLRAAAAAWLGIVRLGVSLLWRRAPSDVFLFRLGYRCGRLAGSVRHRVLCL